MHIFTGINSDMIAGKYRPNNDDCKCQCLPHLDAFREDLNICVDDIHGEYMKSDHSKNFCEQNALYRIRLHTKLWLWLLQKNFYMFDIKPNWNEMKTNNITHTHDLCVEWVCQFLFETNKIWINKVKMKPLFFSFISLTAKEK